MNPSQRNVLAGLIVIASWCYATTTSAQTPGSAFLGTRWGMPAPKAVLSPPSVGGTFGPGAADWSIVPMNTVTLMPPDSEHPIGAVTLDFDGLLPPANVVRPALLFQQALQVWSIGSLGAWNDLLNVADLGGMIGDNTQPGNTSNDGDIRVAVLRWKDPFPDSSQIPFDVIAHGFSPDTLGDMLYAGTIGGDVHFRPHKFGPDGDPLTIVDNEPNGVVWVDDPLAGAGEVDLLTVMIHEVGHALGLDHNINDPGSVMQPMYAGPKRSLSTTDRRNIRQLYGLAVPEPSCAILLGMLLPFVYSRSGCKIA